MLAHGTAGMIPHKLAAYVAPHKDYYNISLRIFVGLFFMPIFRK